MRIQIFGANREQTEGEIFSNAIRELSQKVISFLLFLAENPTVERTNLTEKENVATGSCREN